MQLVCGIGDFIFLAREALSGHERYLPVSFRAIQLLLFNILRYGHMRLSIDTALDPHAHLIFFSAIKKALACGGGVNQRRDV